MIENRKKGFSFVEILFAVAVGSMVIIAAMNMFIHDARNSRKVTDFVIANQIANLVFQKTKLLKYNDIVSNTLHYNKKMEEDMNSRYKVDVSINEVIADIKKIEVIVSWGNVLLGNHKVTRVGTVYNDKEVKNH